MVLLASLLLWPGSGCARRQISAVAPTTEELPHIEQDTQIIPARIGVEGRRDERRLRLVPDYTEPELTPVERVALGEREDVINWLEFYVPQPDNPLVWSEYGGVTPGIHGIANSGAGVYPWRSSCSVWSEMGGTVVGIHSDRTGCVGRSTQYNRPVSARGPVSNVRVGEGPRSGVSAHQTRPDP